MKIVYPFDYEKIEKKDNYSIGIHWIFGSFSHEASEKFFPNVFPEKNYKLKELIDAESVFNAVSNWKVDIWICAFANSWSWGYVETLKAMSYNSFTLLSTIVMPLNMCLITHIDVKTKDDIKQFYWHPVAIRQCEETLLKDYPNITIEKATDKIDTALSAKMLNDWDLSKNIWVFGSKTVAWMYPNIKVFRENMHHDPRNATFFIIFTK